MITVKLDGENDPTYPYLKNSHYWPSLWCKIRITKDKQFVIEEMPDYLSDITNSEVSFEPMGPEDRIFGGRELFPGRWDIDTPEEPGEYVYVMELDDLIEWRDILNAAIQAHESRI